MGVYETRQPRPNSIELHRPYPSEQLDGSTYEQLTPQMANQYAATFGPNGGQQMQHMQHQQQMYDAGLYQSHALYGQTGGQGVMSPEPIYGPGGTPTRNKPRPSQPPPAPPSNGSGGGTPTASNANTPTRGRSMSTSRDALPPPPPVPDIISPMSVMNGANSGHMAVKLLGRASNASGGAGSPQMTQNSMQNADMVMTQLTNTFNSIGMQGGNQLNSLSDLPPPPPVPDQVRFLDLFIYWYLISPILALTQDVATECGATAATTTATGRGWHGPGQWQPAHVEATPNSAQIPGQRRNANARPAKWCATAHCCGQEDNASIP